MLRRRCSECRKTFLPAPSASATHRVCGLACRKARVRKLARKRRGCELEQCRAAERERLPQTTDIDQFVQSLAIAFRDGEVRATHRKKDRERPTAPRHWRTRKDPFDDVWERLECRLVESPDTTALALFESLQVERPGRYSSGQLRTLQRRVKAWWAIDDCASAFVFPSSLLADF
jgi:hypothetical protein